MNKHRIHTQAVIALAALAALAGCNTVPEKNMQLESARSDYRAVQANPQTVEWANPELKLAGEAVSRADASWAQRDDTAEVNHWAYIAKQRIAVAQETTARKAAEKAVADTDAARDKMRLAARTNEADTAQRTAENAQRQADMAKQDALNAQRQAGDAEARNAALQAQIKDLNAKKTDRGLVITLGDVLFDTNKTELKAGGARNVEKLVAFLNQYPQRKAVVEGFTDSVGSDSSNQALSSRRADSVRMAIVGMGVGSERITAHGYGEAHPVASNDSAEGRQLNRRVEIILSDDNGSIAPR